jgi:hypothetical protein
MALERIEIDIEIEIESDMDIGIEIEIQCHQIASMEIQCGRQNGDTFLNEMKRIHQHEQAKF